VIASRPANSSAIEAWLPSLRSRPDAQSRLFCFPYAGAGAAVYAGWQRELLAGVEVVPIHLPGREERMREPCFRRLDPLLDALAEVLSQCLDLPYAFYGHSLGGWIAYYLAQRFAWTGERMPAHLFIGASRAPHLRSQHPPIHSLPPDRFAEQVNLRYGQIPPAILAQRELMDLLIPIVQADMEMFETVEYRPGAPLATPISAFAGETDGEISLADVAAWREFTRSRFSCESLPGNHFFLKSCASTLLNRLGQEMRSIPMLQGSEHPGSASFQPAPVFPFNGAAGEVHVWRVPLDCPPSETRRLAELLGTDERQRAGQYVFPRDRDRFTVGRGRLRLLLSRYLGKDPAALEFRYGYAGKPDLVGPCVPFNVSHSDGLALIAIGGPGRLGIDIEKIRPRKEMDSLRSFFAPAEEAALDDLPLALRERAFFACWTRKEAYIKGRGDGLSFGLDRFEVSVNPDLPAELLRVPDEPDETARWELRTLNPGPEYTAALAVEGHGWKLLSLDWIADWRAND
jgi:medium-chain acyl-[acyl-carrier-protein] hydrolase